MALWMIIVVVCFLLAIKFCRKNDNAFVMIFIFTALSFIVGNLLVFVIGALLPTKMEVLDTMKMISVKDSNALEGSFVLGTGSINQVEYYTFYREWGNGYKKEKVPVKDSVVFEENDKVAELIVMKKVYKEPWMNYVGLILTGQRKNEYELHVPKGTIIREFSLQ